MTVRHRHPIARGPADTFHYIFPLLCQLKSSQSALTRAVRIPSVLAINEMVRCRTR
jgi:hypothetical protein